MGDSGYRDRSEEALDRALFRTRAYRPWGVFDPGPGSPVEARYAALPTTDKAFIRAAAPDGLVPEGRDLAAGLAAGEVELVTTSGTTDERVTNVWDQRWWNYSESESWKLNALTARVCTGSHREAVLTSARNVGPLSDGEPLSFEARRLGRLLFLNERSSPLLWTEETVRRMAEELERYRPQVLEANPSYLARLARWACRLGLELAQPEAVVFTYENPSGLHLRQIAGAFPCPWTSSYGTTEVGYVHMRCEAGRFHLNDAACRADFVPLEGAAPEVGTLRVTPFGNEWVSLLRFDPGDIVRRAPAAPCPCGRAGALQLESVEGRVKCLTYTTAGLPVTPAALDRSLVPEEALAAYQLLQEGPGRYTLLAEVDGPGTAGAGGRLRERLSELYGTDARIEVRAVEALAPEASGKYLPAKTALAGP